MPLNPFTVTIVGFDDEDGVLKVMPAIFSRFSLISRSFSFLFHSVALLMFGHLSIILELFYCY